MNRIQVGHVDDMMHALCSVHTEFTEKRAAGLLVQAVGCIANTLSTHHSKIGGESMLWHCTVYSPENIQPQQSTFK